MTLLLDQTASIQAPSGSPTPQIADLPIDCTANPCPPSRNFIIVYGDKGLGIHSLGNMPRFAAETHKREVGFNQFPGVPAFTAVDVLTIAHISTVSQLVVELQVGNIIYLAYFGHSNNNGNLGVLLIGEDNAPDTNLSNVIHPNCTPVNVLPPSKFRTDGQVRLFGCRGAYDGNSIAEQMAVHLHLPVYGYENNGGAIFTTDVTLGHGQRKVTQADLEATTPNSPANLWLVPANGQPSFVSFGP
jgi:hypothetical protein